VKDIIKFLEETTDAIVAERDSDSLHPSGLRGCDRKLLLGATGAKKTNPMDIETKWKLSRFGTYEALLKPGLVAYAQEHDMALVDQLELRWMDFHGYVDFALRDQHGDEHIYVEIKSSAPSAFSKGSMPYEAHVAQAQAYYVMGWKAKIDWRPWRVLILYVSRWYDGKLPDFRIFDVTPTQEEQDELIGYMALMNDFKKQKHIPDVPFSHSAEHPFLCTRKEWKTGKTFPSCEYFDLCWSEELPL